MTETAIMQPVILPENNVVIRVGDESITLREGKTAKIRRMEVGSAIVIPDTDRPRYLQLANQALAKIGRQFITRKQPDGSVLLIRIK